MWANRLKKPSDAEKCRITAACEGFIDDILKPRFLLETKGIYHPVV